MNQKRKRLNAEKRHKAKLRSFQIQEHEAATQSKLLDRANMPPVVIPPVKSDYEVAYQEEVDAFYDAGYPLDDIVDEIAREKAAAYANDADKEQDL